MSSRTTIDPLSITDGKISNQAKINPKKIAPADEASFLISQDNRKFQPKTIHGDGTIDADGRLTIVQTDTPVAEEAALPDGAIKVGTSSGENDYIKVGSGAGDIAVRDANGDLHAKSSVSAVTATSAASATRSDSAETADLATNADKLDNQEGSYYTDVDNYTYPAATTTTVDSNETTTTKRVHEVVEFVPSSNYGTSNYPITFEHLMPYIPDVSVFILESNEYHEVDAKVKATAADGNTAGTVSVDVSETGLNLKVIAS